MAYLILNWLVACLVIPLTLCEEVGKGFSIVLVGGGLDDNNDAIWTTVIALGIC